MLGLNIGGLSLQTRDVQGHGVFADGTVWFVPDAGGAQVTEILPASVVSDRACADQRCRIEPRRGPVR